MKLVLVGAVEGTRVALETLARHGEPPAAVVTLPLSKSGRHSDFADLRPLARAHDIPVVEAADINGPDAVRELGRLKPDWLLVFGWSQICGPEVMATARQAVLGYHPAPLPENRGRAVIPWTILQRRRTTGGTIFWMDRGVDSGDILVQRTFDVAPDETARTLYRKHLECLSQLLGRALAMLREGKPPRTPQDPSKATWCAKRAPEDGLIDWSKPAEEVWTLVRAVGEPYPGAFTLHRGRRLTVWEADFAGDGPYWGLPGQVQAIETGGVLVQCGDRRHVRLRSVQGEGGPRESADRVLRLHERLGR